MVLDNDKFHFLGFMILGLFFYVLFVFVFICFFVVVIVFCCICVCNVSCNGIQISWHFLPWPIWKTTSQSKMQDNQGFPKTMANWPPLENTPNGFTFPSLPNPPNLQNLKYLPNPQGVGGRRKVQGTMIFGKVPHKRCGWNLRFRVWKV